MAGALPPARIQTEQNVRKTRMQTRFDPWLNACHACHIQRPAAGPVIGDCACLLLVLISRSIQTLCWNLKQCSTNGHARLLNICALKRFFCS
jgi:hypothetical protein